MSNVYQFPCPGCGETLEASVLHSGQPGRCACGAQFTLPEVPDAGDQEPDHPVVLAEAPPSTEAVKGSSRPAPLVSGPTAIACCLILGLAGVTSVYLQRSDRLHTDQPSLAAATPGPVSTLSGLATPPAGNTPPQPMPALSSSKGPSPSVSPGAGGLPPTHVPAQAAEQGPGIAPPAPDGPKPPQLPRADDPQAAEQRARVEKARAEAEAARREQARREAEARRLEDERQQAEALARREREERITAAKDFLESQGQVILAFAYPTAELTDMTFDGIKDRADGLECLYTLRYVSPFESHGRVQFAFRFDAEGRFRSLRCLNRTAFLPPGTTVGVALDLIREEVRRDPDLRENPLVQPLLSTSGDAMAILTSFLQMRQ